MAAICFSVVAQSMSAAEIKEIYKFKPELSLASTGTALVPRTTGTKVSVPAGTKAIEVWEEKESVLTITVLLDNVVDINNTSLVLSTPFGIVEEADFARYYPDISLDNDSVDGGKKVVVIKNPIPGEWGVSVLDSARVSVENFTAYFRQDISSINPSLKILDISQNADGSEVTITYEAKDPDTATKFDLYYSTNNECYDLLCRKTIASDLPENDSQGTFVWNTKGIKPGKYYVYGVIKNQFDWPGPNSNYADKAAIIKNESDVSVNIHTNDVNKIFVFEDITYTVTVTNNGNADAEDLDLLIATTDEFNLISTTIPISEPQGKIEEGLGDFLFRIPRLPVGESQSIDLTFAPKDSVTVPSSVSAWLIKQKTYDSNGKNNRDNAYVNVAEVPRFRPSLLLKRIDRDLEQKEIKLGQYETNAQQNQPYTYEIAVVNIGQGTATGVVVTERIADLAAQLIQVTPTQGDYSFDSKTQTITVNFGDISSRETQTVRVTVIPKEAKEAVSTSTLNYNEKQQTADRLTTRTTIVSPN